MATVLIVDDRAINRELLTTLIGYQGHRLLEASDGAQGLALAAAHRPDVVITDILMPTMDGYEFVRQLRADPALAETTVIFYTAHYHGAQAERLAAECGVEYILTKPCEPEAVLHMLEVAIGRPEIAAMASIASVAPGENFDRAHLQLLTDKLSEKAEEAQRTGERLQALIDVSLQLASERNPRRLLERVCHAARELVGAKYALLASGARDGAVSDHWLTSGMDAAVAARLGIPVMDQGVPGNALRTRKACRAINPGGEPEAVGLPAAHPPVHTLLVAPIRSLSHNYGWIALTDKLGADAFSAQDEKLLGILCAQLGRTYENGSLYRELQASETRYRTIFDNSVLGIFALNPEGEMVSVNSALVRMLGYEREGATEPGTGRFVHEVYADPAERSRLHAMLAEHRIVENFETRWRRQDGDLIWISLSARLVASAGDAGISYIGLVEDITEKRRLRDAVREREAGLRHAEHMARLAHVVTAADGLFETWSETLSLLTGLDAQHLPRSTRSWFKRVHPADRQRFRDSATGAARRHERTDLEYRLTHGSGGFIHVRHSMEPLAARGVAGGSRWFNTLQDISERKRAEERIKRLNRVLAVLSAINSAIVRLHDRDTLFAEACRIAVVEGAFKMAWIGEVDPVTLKGTVVSSRGTDQRHVDSIRFSGALDAATFDLPTSRAVRDLEPVLCNDIGADAVMAPFRDDLLRRGHQSLAVFPLIVGGKAVAVLSLHADEAGFFDDEEMRLLNELAGDIAFALEYIAREQKLDYLAYYDALTGLPNSTLFRDRLDQLLTHIDGGEGVALYLIDLEHFTHVNDTLGRQAGDILLRLVADRFSGALPKSSSVARISADTFAVVVSELGSATDASADFLEDRIFRALEPGFQVEKHDLRVSAQAGIALYPGDGADADALFKHAEAALKQAKAQQEKYLYYAPAMNVRMSEKVTLEGELRDALAASEFVLHYQPKVDLSSGHVISSEALLRWEHPTRGLLPPGQFIAIAEDSDIIIPIGDWVLRTACAQTKRWHDAGLPRVSVSVNLSARQFRDEALQQRVQDALRDTGLDPASLELELTENIVMHDAERFVEKLGKLKELGVKLSLDDFGTGYSSLSYLKRFPLDLLKVDQSFIRDVTTNPDDAAIVRAIISVGHSLGLQVVAEGVETEAQAEWLRRERCEQLQGYHFSRPLVAADFEELLRTPKNLFARASSGVMEGQTLLVVDDEEYIIASLVRLLRKDGYRILTALSAEEALDLLALNIVHVIVCDHRMPTTTGAEFLSKVKALYPDTVRILFSGYIEMETLTDAVNRGAVYRFLLKPWDDDVLRENIREAFHHYWLTHKGPLALAPARSVALGAAVP